MNLSPFYMPGYVYFMTSGCAVKIGFSRFPYERIKQLRRQGYRPLTLLGTMPSRDGLERELHQRFAAYRISGEWFRPSSELAEFIAVSTAEAP